MEKLLIYYNLNTGAFYSKWVLHTDYHEGDVNQYDHLVVQEIVYDYNLRKYVSVGNKVRVVFYKKRIIDKLIYFLIKIRDK